jgi:hypothetical protein
MATFNPSTDDLLRSSSIYYAGWWFQTAAIAQVPSRGAVDFAERWAGVLCHGISL